MLYKYKLDAKAKEASMEASGFLRSVDSFVESSNLFTCRL